MDIPIAANVLGTLGAICWSIQLIPQIIINYRRHDTTGLQPTMMLLWASAGNPLGVYNIVQNFNVALQIQPQILTLLSLITWGQCQYYGVDSKWSLRKCVIVAVPVGLVMGCIELGLVFGLRAAVTYGINWPSICMAVISAVLLSAGVLRHYWDIYKERTVRGISFMFVGIDALGDLTSLVSIFFQPHIDILGMVIYGSELILWLGVFACGGWFNLRPKLKVYLTGRREAESGSVNSGGRQSNSDGNSRAIQVTGALPSVSPASSTVFRTASRSSSEHTIRLRNVAQV